MPGPCLKKDLHTISGQRQSSPVRAILESPTPQALPTHTQAGDTSCTMPGPEDSFGVTHESDTVIAYHTPMNVDADDDDLYEAEKIVDTMIEEDGTKVYRIRWAGCSEDQDTWEPIENLPEDLLFYYRNFNRFELSSCKTPFCHT